MKSKTIHYNNFKTILEQSEGVDIKECELRNYNLHYIHNRLRFLLDMNAYLDKAYSQFRIKSVHTAGFLDITKKTKKKCKVILTNNHNILLKSYDKEKTYKKYSLKLDYAHLDRVGLNALLDTMDKHGSVITTNYIKDI